MSVKPDGAFRQTVVKVKSAVGKGNTSTVESNVSEQPNGFSVISVILYIPGAP